MKFFADFHIHSKYSRATSPDMVVEGIAKACEEKGIGLVGTGDFTHPAWFSELKEKLVPAGDGLFRFGKTHFILTVEVSNIYAKKEKFRKIHTVLFSPSFEQVEAINNRLANYGKLASDGRPILSLDAGEMVEMILEVAPDTFILPAHIWTPHFSLFGSKSGFDRIEDCFGNMAEKITALETGLSSDPRMNWRLSDLDRYTLLSNSDAHSPSKLGREANCFDCELSYPEICDAIRSKDSDRLLFTVEFFPEEGKYHYDGHRKCSARVHPEESIVNNDLCPVCGKRVTIGVLHRVMDLCDRKEGDIPAGVIPYRNLIPLREVIAEAFEIGTNTATVEKEYQKLIENGYTEFGILLDVSGEDLARVTSDRIADGVLRVRNGDVEILPGYDGVFGEIRIFDRVEKTEVKKEQMNLF
jgi:uncharacterized protein (TIGR00375 family)